MELGTHWIAEAYGCPRDVLTKPVLLRLLEDIPDNLNLTRVGQPQIHEHALDNNKHSIAGIVLIAESHFSLHAFPDSGVVHADLFSCAPFAPVRVQQLLQATLRAEHWSTQTIQRG